MDKPHFDILTVVLYVLVGLIGVLCINSMMKPVPQKAHFSNNVRKNSSLSVFFFIILFTALAVFRKVAFAIGGADTLNYILNFETISLGGRSQIEYIFNKDLEPGFQMFTALTRLLTSSYRIYFILVYGFISFTYVKFIKEKCPKGLIYIPFILLMYPYLRSFNTMRTSLAVGFVLLGLSVMDKKKWIGLILLLISVTFHRMSLLIVPVWLFYYFFKDRLNKLSKKQFLVLTLLGMIFFYQLCVEFQVFLVGSDHLEGTDTYYATHSMGENHLEHWPLVLGHILLYIIMIWQYNKIRWNESSLYLRILFVYDMWIAPAGIILGMWRFTEYFYLVRLSLWCIIINDMSRRKNLSDKMSINIIVLILFTAWLVFRIFKEWDPVKISPYIFDFGWLI